MVPIAVTLLCAALGAAGLNHAVGASLLAAPAHRPPAKAPVAKAAAAQTSKDTAALIERNMFCSSCEPGPAGAPPVDAKPQSSLPCELLATFVAGDPGASAATIVNRTTGRGGQYAVGEAIPGAGELRAVRGRSVDVFNTATGRIERLDIVAAPAAAAPPAAAPPPAAVRAGPEGELLSFVEKGVRRVAEGRYEVDRTVIDKVMTDPSALARNVSVVPAIRDGKTAGFKLRRASSLYAMLGLQSGDTIRAVNGLEITGPDSALAAYSKLRDGSNVALSVERGGQPMKIEYSIR